MTENLQRLSAFSTDPNGGNPAGVWIGDTLPSSEQMQAIAAEVGYSETAFIIPSQGKHRTIRYFSPEAEVPFCGHATIASGVALGQLEGEGTYILETQAGEVRVEVTTNQGIIQAALTSVQPQSKPVPANLLNCALELLNWDLDELNPQIQPALAYAGAWHLIIAANSKQRLDQMHYDFEAMKKLMLAHDLTTIQLIYRQTQTQFHSRNPFPVGGVVEDPATGAAAAALGGYLRQMNLIETPATIKIMQGEIMGRPSDISVTIPTTGGIIVSGTAVNI